MVMLITIANDFDVVIHLCFIAQTTNMSDLTCK